jgi:mono/diheme cytochrome c family protein
MSLRHARSGAASSAALVGLGLAVLLTVVNSGGALAAGSARETFVEVCSICHGVGGKGDGPSAAGLNPRPADFTDCAVMQKQSDATLFTIIKRGGQGAGRSTVMPAWGDSLPDGQIRDLVAVVRGFCKR